MGEGQQRRKGEREREIREFEREIGGEYSRGTPEQ
jgi:hypothetical protein